ncbi:SWIM zinc finger domain-containing protein [Photobacterium sp. TY1-4]|uniref:SWIM zinc finger family protein n=1 Tax=Photobacterium sp. TY1-4 TaxID=2899122 RepID=UPI0021BE2074|nr:SWIM zinc finger family protein [Photobacterium sp. TY1-4]UXI00778.1 SWIM zinc finger family protein [Photobacterium sp. TY1-4]
MMTDKSDLFIDMDEVQQLCGATTFAKGADLALSGVVRNVSINGDAISALVDGSYTYQVQVNTGSTLVCSCTCPAAEYQAMCKHAVAVVLTVSEVDEQTGSESALIHDHLAQLEKDELLVMLMAYLVEDPAAWNRLLTKIRLSEETLSYRDLKSMVTTALPRCEIWSWRDIGDYFVDAEGQLDMVFDAVDSLAVPQQWQLMYDVVERLNVVLERIDDSYGARFGVEALICRKMPEVFARLDWSEKQKAQWLFEHLTPDEFDFFPSIEEHFADAWKDNPHYLALCREAIERSDVRDESPWLLQTYVKPLIDSATDWREVADLKQKIATRTHDYLAVCEMYLTHDEPLDAEYWLSKARQSASKFQLVDCDRMSVKIRVRQGELKPAWQLANQIFEQHPSFQEYQQLARFKKTHNIEDDVFLARVEQKFQAIYRPSNSGYISGDNDALVEFYMDTGALEKACEWAADHQLNADVLLELADRIVDQKPQETLSYYVRVVSAMIEQTNNDAYEKAISLLQQLESQLQNHPNTLAAFYVQVEQLAQTYKRKRNMLKLFQTHYNDYL